MEIAVGYDGSNAAKEALNVACKHAKAFGAKIHVVTSLVGGQETKPPEIEQAKRGLEYAEQAVAKENIPCESHLLIRGVSPGEDLVQFANERDIEQIVIGVRRRSQVGKLLFGSNARQVIMNARCPVVSVK